MVSLAVTGPRALNAKSIRWTRFQLRKWLRTNLLEHDDVHVISGMALGVDTIWAEEAILAGAPLTAYIPYEHQHGWGRGHVGIWMQLHERAWAVDDRNRLESLLFLAESVVDCSDSCPGEMKTPGAMLKWRSKCMANDCDAMGAVWHEIQKGGTYNCLRYTTALEKPVWGMNLMSKKVGLNLWEPKELGL